MSSVTIPNWNAQGVLPPVDPTNPTSVERSPYDVLLTEFVLHFGTTPVRRTILLGLLDFRAALHEAGLGEGFQWIDGSFLEDIEIFETREPADLDTVTFFRLPAGETQRTFASKHPALFDNENTKARYLVDGYFVPLDDNESERLVERSAYWYSLWSHRRNGQWKGYLQIDLNPKDDESAQSELRRIVDEGGKR